MTPHIANLLSRQKQLTRLLHAKAIVFDDFTGEDNVLVLIKLVHDLWLVLE